MQSRDKTELTIALEDSSTPKEQVHLGARERCRTVLICMASRSQCDKAKRGFSLMLH